jgi:para-nitrobenzyl esterase
MAQPHSFAFVLAALVVVALIASGHSATATPVLVVPTQSGNVQGFVQNDLARAFLGIPFADPPQRFGVAAPATPWTGVRNATAFPKPCIQSATLGVEDCLYLNVFTPKNATAGSMLPVMVWIHGGRYWTGESDQYQGQWLSGNGNVVLVTIQVLISAASPLLLSTFSFSFFGVEQERKKTNSD